MCRGPLACRLPVASPRGACRVLRLVQAMSPVVPRSEPYPAVLCQGPAVCPASLRLALLPVALLPAVLRVARHLPEASAHRAAVHLPHRGVHLPRQDVRLRDDVPAVDRRQEAWPAGLRSASLRLAVQQASVLQAWPRVQPWALPQAAAESPVARAVRHAVAPAAAEPSVLRRVAAAVRPVAQAAPHAVVPAAAQPVGPEARRAVALVAGELSVLRRAGAEEPAAPAVRHAVALPAGQVAAALPSRPVAVLDAEQQREAGLPLVVRPAVASHLPAASRLPARPAVAREPSARFVRAPLSKRWARSKSPRWRAEQDGALSCRGLSRKNDCEKHLRFAEAVRLQRSTNIH